jgi:hypothetical protein
MEKLETGVPCGIRTRVAAVRGRYCHPWLLYEGGRIMGASVVLPDLDLHRPPCSEPGGTPRVPVSLGRFRRSAGGEHIVARCASQVGDGGGDVLVDNRDVQFINSAVRRIRFQSAALARTSVCPAFAWQNGTAARAAASRRKQWTAGSFMTTSKNCSGVIRSPGTSPNKASTSGGGTYSFEAADRRVLGYESNAPFGRPAPGL